MPSVINTVGSHTVETGGARPPAELLRIVAVYEAVSRAGKSEMFLADVVTIVQEVLWPQGVSRNAAYNGIVNAIRWGAVIDGEWLLTLESREKQTRKLYEKTKVVRLRRGKLGDASPSAAAGLAAATEALRRALPDMPVTLQQPMHALAGEGNTWTRVERKVDELTARLEQTRGVLQAMAGGMDRFENVLKAITAGMDDFEARVAALEGATK